MTPTELTNLDKVLLALQRRAKAPGWTVRVTGDDLRLETGLPNQKIHDSLFLLVQKGYIKKTKGARYKPMQITLLGPAREPLKSVTMASELIASYLADADDWFCPHCGQPINLRELRNQKKARLEKALDLLEESTKQPGDQDTR